MNRRGARRRSARRQAGRHATILGVLLATLAGVASPATAESARAVFSVTATVVPNCTTRGPITVCTKGVAPPKTTSVRMSPSTASPRGRPSTSQTDLPRSITITVNY